MKPGDIVEIYQGPNTESDSEGKARLIKKIDEVKAYGLEYWEVEFVNQPIARYFRWIKVKTGGKNE
jgi:hypothetical protein